MTKIDNNTTWIYYMIVNTIYIYIYINKSKKFLELDNDDTEDEQLFITELKDNNEVDDENWEQYNLNLLYDRKYDFFIYNIYIILYN